MFTRCPACQTQFRIRARQLNAAGGRVRCGTCGQAFDALGQLSDELLPPAEPAGEVDPRAEPGAADRLPAYADDAEDFELPAGLHGRDEDLFAGKGRAPEATPEAVAIDNDWLSGEAEPAARGHAGRWLIVAALLIVLLLFQAAWFYRDHVYEYLPRLQPWVERLCERIDCQVYRLRNPADIELVNRDVRDHPVYKDALLVNATITNRADSRQPWPRIQLALFDTDGRILVYREFAPQEYLDTSVPASSGMPPDTPIHVVLELAAATAGAVSFEFGFL